MASVFVRHKVNDYLDWKNAFDSFITQRKAGGEKTFKLGNLHGEPNNLCIYFEWDTVENAKKFLESEELVNTMKEAGVIEKPEIYIIDDRESGTV